MRPKSHFSMHLIPLHIGDLSQATERFKPVHMGLYLRLLMEYYKSEKPLTDDPTELEWISGAEAKAEKDALKMVLRRCFVHFPDQKVYRQKRADREIEVFRLAGIQKRHAILCRHWDSVNPGHQKPTLEEFTSDPNKYYDETTGRIRKAYARNNIVLRDDGHSNTPPGQTNYVPVTSNQEPVTSNQSTPVVPTGTAHDRPPSDASLAEAIYAIYPRKQGRKKAIAAIQQALKETGITEMEMQSRVKDYKVATDKWAAKDKQFIPFPATWFNQHRFMDDPATWERAEPSGSQNGFSDRKKIEGGATTAADIELGLEPQAEPDGWREVWNELFTAESPAEWADIPKFIRNQIFDRLDEAPPPTSKKRRGGQPN